MGNKEKGPGELESETLIGLVSHFSPSGSEHNAAQWLIQRMKTLRFKVASIDEAGNAIGIMGSGPKQIVLLGHIDTVPGKIPVRIEEGILYGRGSVDAKGPLACFTDAVAQVGAQDGWQFIVIGAVEEERDSNGARFIAPRYTPDFAIIGEPNRWDRISLGYKGSAWVNATIRREQAHTAAASESASEAAVETWLKIKEFAYNFNNGRDKAFDKLLPTLRGMESGTDGFEQWARLSIGTRLPLDLPPAEWYAKLTEIIPEAVLEPTGFAVPAWQCEKNTPLVRALLSSIRAAGGTPNFVYKTGTADLNIVAPLWQCPAVVYGPGDSALDHTPDEHISLEEYRKAINVLSEVLAILIK
jgi:[amino group carrier protein]-lysine/ornithine hydrolase